MNLDLRVLSLLANFNQKLSALLDDSECDYNHLLKDKSLHRSEDKNDSDTNSKTKIRKGDLSSDVWSKVSQISRLAAELTCSPVTNLTSQEKKKEEEEWCGSPDHLEAPVIVIGPPGTEPHTGLSNARFDNSQSMVYSRSSIQLPLSRQYLPVEDIAPKDMPRAQAQVVTFFKSEEDYDNRRWTRSDTRNMKYGVRRLKSFYSEESSESESSDEDEIGEYRPRHRSARSERRQAQNQRIDTQAHITSTEGKKSGMVPFHTSAFMQPLDRTINTACSTPTGSSTPTPLEDVAGMVQVSTCDITGTSEDYETPPEYPPDSSDHLDFKPQDPECLPVPTIATTSTKMDSGLSTPSSEVSPTPSPSILCSETTPSGIRTVLNELRASYSTEMRPRKLLKLSTSKSMRGRGFVYQQQRSLKDCKVVVEKLPQKVVDRLGVKPCARPGLKATKERGGERERESSLDSDLTIGSFHKSGDEMDLDQSVSQVNVKTEPKLGLGSSTTTRGKKLKPEATHPKKIATSQRASLSKISKAVPSRLKVPKQEWSSESDFDIPLSSQLQESSGLKKSVSSHKRSDGGGISGRKGEERKEVVVQRKLGKNEKSPKGKDKMSRGLSLPEVIDCTGCGKGIHWSDQPIHSHPRLKVLICMDCLNKFRNGAFTVEDGSEIYCTLCGDGGTLVCCDTCDKSFCRSCITRTTGKSYLKKILSSDTDWNCFMCDSSPLSKQQKLCEALCDHYRNQAHHNKKIARKKLEFGSDSENSSHSSESTSHSSKPSYPSDSSGNGGNSGPAGTSSSCFSPNRKSSRRTSLGSSPAGDSGSDQEMDGGGTKEKEGKENEQQQQSSKSGRGKGKSSSGGDREKGDGEENKRLGSSGRRGGGDRRRGNLWKESSSESDSNNNGSSDSVEVNTDDVSMSDSSLFDSDCGAHQKKRSKKQQHQREAQSANPGTDSDASGQEPQSLSVSSTLNAVVKPEQVTKRRKKKINRLSSSILSDSDFEDQPLLSRTKNPKKRPLSMSSTSSSDGKLTRKKKSRFASALSSGSESESGRWNLRSKVSDDDDNDGGGTLHSPSPSMLATPLPSDKPINYATRSRVGSSSDSDGGLLGRTRGSKKRIKGLLSSKGEKDKPQRKKLKRAAFQSSDDDDFEDLSLRGPRLKRRVRKSVLTSDSDTDSDQETEVKREDEDESSSNVENSQEGSPDKSATPGKKRKKIRKLITDSKLAVDTKTAQRLERERMERLKKRAKLLGDAKDEARLILEQDEETKEVKLEVRKSLVRHIKPHQREGIKFLYNAVVESLSKSGERSGAVLAHCMGLGKSLQVIAFIDALLNSSESEVSRVLILSPVNTIHNWMNEFNLWIPYSKCDYNIYLMTAPGRKQRHHQLRRWFDGGGIMFIGYDMFRNLAQGKHMKRKTQKEEFQKFLLDPGPDIIVCDEGHVMRNSKSNISLVLNQVRTLARIVLTGTPLQNNLLEYYTMVSFVKPNLLGTIREFKNRFVNPITNGQCQDSTPYDVRMMKLRAHILHELLVGCVQRRDYRVLAECLPPKQEYVLNIRLSPVQDKLYRRFLDKGSGYHTSSDLFSTFTSLQKVWNHPWVLKLDEQRQNERAERLAMYGESDDSLGGFIVSGSEEEEEEEEEEEVHKKAKKKKKKKPSPQCGSSLHSSRSSSVCSAHPSNLHSRSTTPSNDIIVLSSGSEDDDKPCIIDCNIKSVKSEDMTLPDSTSSSIPGPSGIQPAQPVSLRPESPPRWYHDLLLEECESKMDISGKLLFLFELLQEAEKLKEKVLVFTQSLLTLDIIEMFLNKEEFGDWTPGMDYYRLDGSTKSDIRTSYMAEFNAKDNSRMRLFLISTRAGSLGVNLVAANRVVIFDACWNPSHDLQAVFRTYRFGQTKPIFVYRLLAQGTMEEKIYDRQVTKQSLSMRVVDEKQIGRHYTASDLAELFTYTPSPPLPLPGTQPDKPYERPEADIVLCSILDRLQPQSIVSYHEHDSLLEHVFDEELTEEERKAAWEKYKADMAAESVQYNYQALQNRLEEEQLEQRAQVQRMQQMIQDQTNSATASSTDVGGFLYKLSTAVSLVNSLTSLQKKRDVLVRHLSNHQVQHPPYLKGHLQEVEMKFQENFSKLGDAIQQVNMLITQFQSTNHTSTISPTFRHMVNNLHMTFLNQLEALKRSTPLPGFSLASHPPYVGTSHGPPPPPNITLPQDMLQRTMPPTHTPAHLLPHSHTQNLRFHPVTGHVTGH